MDTKQFLINVTCILNCIYKNKKKKDKKVDYILFLILIYIRECKATLLKQVCILASNVLKKKKKNREEIVKTFK